MKLHSRTIILNKPVNDTFSFMSKLENWEKQIPDFEFKDHIIEVDDNLQGDMEIGEVISFYMFGIYEEDDDKSFDLEIVDLYPNERIQFELVHFSKYDEEADNWSKHVPLEILFGKMQFEIIFEEYKGQTKLKMFTICEPRSRLASFAFWFFNLIGKLSDRKYYAEWSRLIERYA